MWKPLALTLASLLTGAFGSGSFAQPVASDHWPQWRGPGGAGIGAASTYPDAWSLSEGIETDDERAAAHLEVALQDDEILVQDWHVPGPRPALAIPPNVVCQRGVPSVSNA